MSEKEAIAILENLKIQGCSFFSRRLALDLAIKAIRIVEVIEEGFKRDGNMIDSDDWEDIKEFVEKETEDGRV